jgi:hypothetical protein
VLEEVVNSETYSEFISRLDKTLNRRFYFLIDNEEKDVKDILSEYANVIGDKFSKKFGSNRLCV